MRCIECEEIELARVRDQRPAQTLPIPYAALDGFPAGRSPSHLTRRRLMQWGVAGARRSTRPRSSAGSRSGSRSPRRPRRAGRRSAWCCSTSRAATTASTSSCPAAARDYSALRRPRAPEHRPRRRAPTPTAAVGSLARCPARAAPPLAFANVVGRRGTDNNGGTAGLRHALRRRHRRPGLRPRGHARGRRQEVLASATSTTPTSGSRRATTSTTRRAGWAAGSTATGTPNNPLQAVSIDTALSKAIRTAASPVCAINVAADGRLQADRQPAAERVQQHTALERGGQQPRAASPPARATPISRARARPTGSTYTTAQLAGDAYAPAAGTYPTTGYADRS